MKDGRERIAAEGYIFLAFSFQEMMLNELVRHSSSGGDGQLNCMSAGRSLNPAQGLQSSSCASGLDTFLGQAGHGTVESHVRQSSTDSGLGERSSFANHSILL